MVIFTALKNCCMLHGRVFIMATGVISGACHYVNTPMQYTTLNTAENNFPKIICGIFLNFPRNMLCGYSLEPPNIEAVLKSSHNLCFNRP